MNALVLLVLLLLLIVAALHDVRTREVPDWISAALLAWGVVATAASLVETGWFGFASGLALGVAVGALMFRAGGWGGGDAKLIAALGATLGPGGLLLTLFWTAVAGGGLALLAAARGRQHFAYVPAIAIGLAAHALSMSLSSPLEGHS